MKIENPNPNTRLTVEPLGEQAKPAQAKVPAAGADRVELSASLRLAHEAVRAAEVSSDVRPDAVARARALLESGALGADLDALADRMIDRLTDSHDDTP